MCRLVSTTITVLLCIRSGRAADIDHAESARLGQYTERYSAVVLVTTAPRVTVARTNETDRPAPKIQDDLSADFQTPAATGRPEPQNHSTAELLRGVNSNRSPGDGSVGDNFTVDDLYPTDILLADNDTTVGGDGEPNQLKETAAVAVLHPTNNRAVKHNKMVDGGQSTTGTNSMATEKDASNGHQKLYDSPYKMRVHTDDDILADGFGWNTKGRPENTNPVTPWAGGLWNQPHRGTGNYGYGYLNPSPNTVAKDNNNRMPVRHKENKTIDWRTLGVLAFVKLGLAKLQAIGFLNSLLLIAFKLKLYTTAVFFKFVLIMKLMKLFKTLVLPLFVLQLLPTLMQLLLSTRSSNNNIMAGLPATTQPSRPGGLLPGVTRPGGTTGTGLSGGVSGTGLPSITTGTGLPSTTTGTGRPGGTRLQSSFKFDDLNSNSKRHNESSISLLDPTWEIFQQVLDSEKCMERIACQISVAEKTGVIPPWINWMLYRISTFMPSDKLKFYLKTYKNINNDIFNNSTSAENGTTWCLERYKCNK